MQKCLSNCKEATNKQVNAVLHAFNKLKSIQTEKLNRI